MGTKFFLICLVITLTALAPAALGAAEKLKFGTGVRLSAPYYLTMLAAEEKGLWKENGLDAEWFPLRGAGDYTRAMAAGVIKVGASGAVMPIEVWPRGVRLAIVSDLTRNPFVLWVRSDSRFREGNDLRGAKIGVSSLSGIVYVYAVSVTKALGLQKDVRFVGVGDLTTAMASLKTGAIDVAVYGIDQMADLKFKGEVRELVNASDYQPKEWVDLVIQAREDLVKSDPATVKRVVKAVLQSVDFVTKNPAWSVEKIKSTAGFSEGSAKLTFDFIRPLFTRDGKIERKALENVINFLIEYDVLPRDKAPKVEDLYTGEFVK